MEVLRCTCIVLVLATSAGSFILSRSIFCGPQANTAVWRAYVQEAVREEVDAAVERLRKEYEKREAMLMSAVMSHAEHERDLLERISALEKKLAGSGFGMSQE